jgi:hypothetical protein
MRATRNFHWAYVSPEGDWPNRKSNYTEISHPGYQPSGFDSSRDWDFGEILLKPEPNRHFP